MSILRTDPLTQLSFSVYENKGVFALLLGSGLSRAADIPTGWEITLDLIRRVALAGGVEEQTNWEEWCRDTTGEEPDYSALLAELASTQAERRSILHSYIEPDEEEREQGKKLPTKAHRAIAELVQAGYIRVIITTNFDRLLENALREAGVEPTIVSSVDALAGAEPLTHCPCYILKVHGDYKDTRILNTDDELATYPDEYKGLLARIFDEYGLIVSGWSGEWDHALRKAILSTPNRRYPVFWAARGKVGDRAQELIEHRDAKIVACGSADEFFVGIAQRVTTLEKTHRQNPLSTTLLVNTVKRFLPTPEYRIQLDDLIAEEISKLIEKLESANMNAGSDDGERFRHRVSVYEAVTEPLARIAGVLGRWGEPRHMAFIVEMIRSVFVHADKDWNGITTWLHLRSYPAVLIFTGYCLGLVRARQWQTLHAFLSHDITRQRGEPERMVDKLYLWTWEGSNKQLWQVLEGLENHKTPESDHLLDVYQDWGSSFAAGHHDFEYLFEMFEMLASITYVDNVTIEQFDQASPDNGGKGVWCPLGRSGWHTGNFESIVREITADKLRNELIAAGFCNGDTAHLDKAIQNYASFSSRMRLFG